jgi:hypothetical protein
MRCEINIEFESRLSLNNIRRFFIAEFFAKECYITEAWNDAEVIG